MGLVANSNELSISDLIQVKGQGRGACTFSVRGGRGHGLLCLRDGEVVFAEYAGFAGVPAARAILAEGLVSYRVTSGSELPPSNMRVEHRRLLMEAAVSRDEQQRAPVPAGQEPDELHFEPPRAVPSPVARRTPLRALGVGAAAAALLVLGVTGTVSLRRTQAVAEVASVPAPRAPDPVEASALSGARDARPVVVAGEPPRSPNPEVALRPTVVLRLLIDEAGRVVRAEVYQPRPDLAEFERAAVAAALRYAFRPALREGQPVPAWVNWPVDFI
jgi:protein TonB